MNLKTTNNMTIEQLTKCLACNSDNLLDSLNLGNQPLANSYLRSPEQHEDRFPLAVNLCKDCFHLQLTHVVDPAVIYKNYLYVSGTTKTLKDYSDWFAGFVSENISRKTNNVLDIGCNDGTQLDYFATRDFKTFGIDPAENIYATSSAKHNVICDFFGSHVVEKFTERFDAITAQNVFAHNPNPYEFLLVCKNLMDDHTKLFIQTSQANMVLNNEFDTIYHEHVNFFNINSMTKLVERAGLKLIDAIRTPIHGTSYVFVIAKTGSANFRIQNALSQEQSLTSMDTYKKWVDIVNQNMNTLFTSIEEYKQKGYKVIGYGAAAKGNTLLNFVNINLDYIIDDNPLKQGLYTPGTHIPIVSIDILNTFPIEEHIIFMPLAWNFFNEIRGKIKVVRDVDSDLFLQYFPKVRLDV